MNTWARRSISKLLNRIPEKGIWGRFAGWFFSLAIVGLFIAGFFYSGSQASLKMITWWAAITAAFSALGALILLAHPLTIAASAIAAPITTLHPLIAAGWVAGLVEATLRKPQVKDFLALAERHPLGPGVFPEQDHASAPARRRRQPDHLHRNLRRHSGDHEVLLNGIRP